MKNINNLKSILVHSLCISGILFLTASCSENKANDSRKVDQENIAILAAYDSVIVVVENDDDGKFLMEAAELQMEEIRLGKLAQQKGNAAHVKELGKTIEADHTKSLMELKVLAQSKSVTIADSVSDGSIDGYEKLRVKTGNDFDKAYTDMMVKHHEDAIDLYEDAASDSEDPEIRNWASKQLPGLRTRLNHAEQSKEKCDKMK